MRNSLVWLALRLSSGSCLPTFARIWSRVSQGVIDAGDELPDADVPEWWCLYLEVFQQPGDLGGVRERRERSSAQGGEDQEVQPHADGEVEPAGGRPKDASHEAEVRQLMTRALVQQTAPGARTAALIALVHALKCEHRIIDPRRYGLSRRQLRARAAQIAEGNWASEAVRTAIDEMIAAVGAASAAAAAAASAGSG